jgi:hypothetical protein
MKKLPIGIQTFEELIQENYVYIDKTRYIHDLVTTGKYYFLARPRRFGKSLLISTFEAVFSGRKELFADCAITSLEYDWKVYRIIKITFADIRGETVEELTSGIKLYLENIARLYGVTLNFSGSIGFMFRDLVMSIATGNRSVVLLIDEYDSVILQHIHIPGVANEMRQCLRSFYDVIKGLDQYFKFVFLTGVSQFSKTSIFSGLNNLNDISMDDDYASICGYTHDELNHYFNAYIEDASRALAMSDLDLVHSLKNYYDGYRFTQLKEYVFNPYSILLFFKKRKFGSYWFATGTPTFLVNLIKSRDYPFQDLGHSRAIEAELKQFDIETLSLKTLMFQTGYLTIKDYLVESQTYVLGYPNKETVDGLGYLTVESMAKLQPTELYSIVASLLNLFNHHKLDELYSLLTTLFALIPYTIQMNEEKYYQTIFYVVLKMLNADIIVEKATNIGRIDAILTAIDCVYIIEFKINTTALQALNQIKEKKYYQPYMHDKKNIVLVGIAFDTTLKNVSEILYESL